MPALSGEAWCSGGAGRARHALEDCRALQAVGSGWACPYTRVIVPRLCGPAPPHPAHQAGVHSSVPGLFRLASPKSTPPRPASPHRTAEPLGVAGHGARLLNLAACVQRALYSPTVSVQ